ncbi:AMP-binding protein [Myxococcota bacterium]
MSRAKAHTQSELACEPSCQTLIEALRQAALEEKDRLFVNLLDTRNRGNPLSFARVLAGAEHWARFFAARGIGRGDRVVLLLPTSEEFLFALFGTLIVGGTPVPCPYPLALGNAEDYVLSFAHIITSAQPRALVTTDRYQETAARLIGGQTDRVLVPDSVTEAPATTFPQVTAEETALLQYASGPVGAPTGVELTHRHVLCNVFGLGRALGLSRDDVALNWVPLVHDMGLIGGLFTSLYWRLPLHVMSPQAFLMHPHLWLKNISDFRVSLSVAPNAAFQLCVRRVRDKHLDGLDLSCWRLALNGAETVHHRTVEAFCDRFGPAGFRATAMLPTYGLAENTLATACPSLNEPARTAPDPGDESRQVVSVGLPLAGQQLAILDDEGIIMPEHEVGEIAVRGPCVMSRYHNNEDATRRAIHEGWLRTGDLGFVTDSHLFITGRKKEMVIKMGRNYYPDDIERVVMSNGRTAVAFARPNTGSGTEDLVLILESEPLDSEAEKKLRSQVNADLLSILGIRADDIVLVPPDTIPSHLSRSEQRRQMNAHITSNPVE